MTDVELPTRDAGEEPTIADSEGPPRTLGHDEIPNWIGRFVVLGVLGRGGMGVVVSAYDPELDRKVAIKLVGGKGATAEARARMKREAQALAKLAHPNVIAVYDVGEIDRGLYIAMEHVEGTTLHQWLEVPRPLPRVLERFIDAGRGLAAAHAEGLVHRDFKPSNVLVGDDGRVRVLDFGLARRDAPSPSEASLDASATGATVDSSPAWNDVTRAGVVMGTPAYMAPEQIRLQDVDPRADQFALCVALWEATTGVRPFPHRDLEARYRAIAKGTVHEGKRMPPGWLRRALLRGMALRPEQRHADVATLLEILERTPKRRRWIAAGIVAVAGLGGVTAAVVSQRAPETVERCDEGTALIAQAYDAADRQAIVDAMAATGLAMAPEVSQRVTAQLDALGERWATVHRETCEATLVRRERSQASFDETLSCLTDVRRQIDLRVEMLRQADAVVTREAFEVLDSVVEPDRCANADALAQRRSLEPPEAIREQVQALAQEYDRLQAERVAKPSLADTHARWSELVERTEALGHAPLIAKALSGRASVRRAMGRHPDAEDDYTQAFVAAVAGGDISRAMSLAMRIAYGYDHDGKDAEVERWLALASGLADRQELPPLRREELECSRAELLFFSNDTGRAIEMLDGVLRRLRSLPPSAARETLLARTEMTIARSYVQHGKAAAGLEAADRAAEILARRVGEHHPRYGDALEQRAGALLQLRRPDEALATLERIQAINDAAGAGTSASGAAIMRLQVAVGLRQQQRYEEALAQVQEALALSRAAGSVRAQGYALERRCLIEESMGRLDTAMRSCEESLTHSRKYDDPTSDARVWALTRVGRMRLRLDRLEEGRATLEEAMAVALSQDGASGSRVGYPAKDLAWALLRLGVERARAEELAAMALEHLPQTAEEERAELAAWLAEYESSELDELDEPK